MTVQAAQDAARGGNNQPLADREAIAADAVDRDAAGGDDNPPDDPDLRNAPAGGERVATAPTTEEQKPGKPTFEGDDTRAAIFAAAKANRGKEFINEEEQVAADVEGDNGLGKPAAGAAGGDKPAVVAPKPIELADDALVVVKVNGEERIVPFSEAKKALGMTIAADQHLADAKRSREEADRLLANARAATAQPDSTRTDDRTNQPARTDARAEPGRDAPRQAHQLDPARLKAIADKVQAGTQDEAVEALAELVQAASGQRSDKPIEAMVTETVANVLEEGERKNEINRALGTVAEKFPDLAKEPDLAMPLFQRFMGDVVTGLKAIGVPEHEIREATSEQMVRGYQKLRRDPQYAGKLKPIDEIAQTAAKAIDDRYLAPARALKNGGTTSERPGSSARPVVVADRSDRKNALSPQPRTASTRADASTVGIAPKRSNPSDVVGKMAAARGQAAAG